MSKITEDTGPVGKRLHMHGYMNSLFTDLASSFVGSADFVGHLYEQGHQLGFSLQLLPQSVATAVPQGSLDLTVPALVVRVIVGILQQPASADNINT